MKRSFGLGGAKALKNYEWFDHELPLSKVSILPATVSTIVGSIIGAICSLIVNCAMVELSISPFFANYFGVAFFIIGIVILWRLNSTKHTSGQSQKSYLRILGLMIVGSGLMCFLLRRNWFIHLPVLAKTLVYTLLGVSISFALTFTIIDLVNYFMTMLETSVSKPLVESKSQVHLIVAIAVTMGAIFGFTFGLMDIEDEVVYHIQLALMKEERYTYPVGLALGGIAGFGNEYLRQQESWRFNKDNAYDVEI
ncbi:hypothetical protein BEWA_033000 [Theileria equi strain WA]|uniref:Uncharacterized protein n=1 Tax=Theileria equi strain WA TaxID=1537102 RepID=L0AXZ8_THEEQ|nr:hypothetical protein BEWA_033000 [Theileria equi strain WA]AFZ80447.1 hypothetical protein BEWA_033000 [Theileria equi strain WA]|eukprot:XP_004830113.1 hypothetical protein BEWA_033000 [Theileria equi strain WA]